MTTPGRTALSITESLCDYFDWDKGSEQAMHIEHLLREYAQQEVEKAVQKKMCEMFEGENCCVAALEREAFKDGEEKALTQAAEVVRNSDAAWEDHLERNAGLKVLMSFEEFIANRILALKSAEPGEGKAS